MHTKIVDLKEYSNDEVGLFVQAILTELLIIFGIVNIFTNVLMPVFYAIIVMLLFTLSYNNYKFYKKKYMTALYLIFGIFVLIMTILENLG